MIKEKVLNYMEWDYSEIQQEIEEAIDITLAEVHKKMKHGIDILKNNIVMVGTLKIPTHVSYKDLYERMDEICLIYSDIFDISFNEAKDKLDCKEFMEELKRKLGVSSKGEEK